MASHQDTRERKRLLNEEMRRAYYDGQEWGDKALSQRALSERYGLSMQTVGVELQKLVEEGVLYTIPRIGTFMGRPPAQTTEIYLLMSHQSPIGHALFDLVQTGFQERVAQLGGVSDALTFEDALSHLAHGEMPTLAGQFFLDTFHSPLAGGLDFGAAPRVHYAGSDAEKTRFDTVDFDNEDGGEQATRHLLQVGHRMIAFLGLHGSEGETTEFEWSEQREAGWRRMMQRAGQDTRGLAFRPKTCRAAPTQTQIARACQTAVELLSHPGITAVIAANVYALHGLTEALRRLKIPAKQWPAIVCFDETPVSRASGVSYLRLPWEKIGGEAAQLLWERKTGRLVGPPQRRLVKMSLIPRLTCRPDWASDSSFAQRRIIELASHNRRKKAETAETPATLTQIS